MTFATHFPNRQKVGGRRALSSAAAIVTSLLALSSAVLAQDRGKIEQQLTAQYAITTPTADNTDLVTVGAVLILQKKGLTTGAVSSNVPITNSYKDGQIKTGAAGTFSKISRFGIPGIPSVPSNPVGNTPTRVFVNGEKVYVTKIEVKNNDVIFSLISDPYDNVRYKGTLSFEFSKNAMNDMAAMQKTIGEVFTIDTSANNAAAGGGQQGAAPANPAAPAAPEAPPPAAEPALAPVAPPPPPPDAPAAPPATIELGQTKDQVIAILGQPQKTAKLTGKEIYFYKNLKVTFKDGKVSDVE